MLAIQFKSLIDAYKNSMTDNLFQQFDTIQAQMSKGNDIQTSSSNLLLLNVEDILGFAQLKAGKFIKIIKKFNIKRAIEEIISIQQYQAASKGIDISTEFIGF